MKQRLADNFPHSPSLDIIQGGMGIRVSSPELAGAVAHEKATGIVSGTGIGNVLVRGLNEGDYDGEIRSALERYPRQEVVERVMKEFYRPNGLEGKPYSRPAPFDFDFDDPRFPKMAMPADIAVLGAFVEVIRAKRYAGGRGNIGMNLLTELEEPTIHTIYGAMQAGVDLIAMGAGIPKKIPGYLQELAEGRDVYFPIEVQNAPSGTYKLHFDPSRYADPDQELEVPRFLAIITSDILARHFMKADPPKEGVRPHVPPDGFIIEEPIAGGHNAPPRNKKVFDEIGQPVYTERDLANMERMQELGMPYWLAGGYGSHEGLLRAKSMGAVGVQMGSVMALTKESGLDPKIRNEMIRRIRAGENIDVYTDSHISPTGYPFKVAQIEGTISDPEVYAARTRICDLGYLRKSFEIDRIDRKTGEVVKKVIYRCPSEPEAAYVGKGGDIEATIGRGCLCNQLFAAHGMAQVHKGVKEPAVVTIGDSVSENVREIIRLNPNISEITAPIVIRTVRGQSVNS